jgi:hypothetical protein
MRRRCTYQDDISWHRYGGRGVVICERWKQFENFLADMGKKPSPTHSLDRIDPHGNYEPANCKWATRTEQARNRRNNTLVTINGETAPLATFVERFGQDYSRIYQRLNKLGWSVEKAFGLAT